MSISSIFNLIAVVITLAAVFGYLNHRWLRLPHTIGMVVIALAVSMLVLVIDVLAPQLGLEGAVRRTLTEIDFQDVLMEGMLSFLLFAGALHVDFDALVSRRWAIGSLATVGVAMSTAIVGLTTFWVFRASGLDVPLPYCLVFGALISPTDPVAVHGILKEVHLPESLQVKITGESLFNDGVGVVVFAALLAFATGGGGEDVTVGSVLWLLVTEAGGGGLFGLATGYLAYRAMRTIDQHTVEVLITLALVMGTFALASRLHLSGPIAVVVAGLFIGNHGKRFAMSPQTRDHIDMFWSLLDEVLNSLLFVAIGFEVYALIFTSEVAIAAAVSIPIVLAARFVSVATPIAVLRLRREYTRGATTVLTWGGLRGGISVALALSLPAVAAKPPLLAATYGVVVFSIIVQGLTIEGVARRAVSSG